MNLNPNDPYDRPTSSYPNYNYAPQISPQKPGPPSTLPVSYPAEVYPPNDEFSSDQQNTPLQGFDINESEILKTDSNRILAGGLDRFDATPQHHVRNFQQAGTRHLVGFQNEQISPLKVASSKDLFETEADLNVNRDLLKNSAQQSSIASALRVARPDAPTPSRTDDSGAAEADHDGLDQYLMGEIKKRMGSDQGKYTFIAAPNQLKPIVFQSFEEGDSSRRRFSPNPCTPHSPSTYMADLRLNSSILSHMNPEECKFCSGLARSKSLKGVIHENLNSKYLTSRDFYNVKIINDIIYNECTHIVSIFKDYLIYDDISEFLKRFYRQDETKTRLPKIFEFYDKYSKVFPNYVILGESKYMFKNIERKQRAIDEKNQQLVEMNKNKKVPRGIDDLDATDQNRLFSTRFINSVAQIKKLGMSSSLANTKRTTTEKSMSVNLQHQRRERPLEEMPLDQLVEKFLAKDSELFINPDEITTEEVKSKPQPKIQTYPKPKIVGFQGSGGVKSEPKGDKGKKVQKEVNEQKKNGLLNLNIVNNYNHIVNENHFQAQTVNIHHNNYFDPAQSRNRQPRQEPRMQPQQVPKTEERNHMFASSRKSTDVQQQPYRTSNPVAQKEERPSSKEMSMRSKTATNLSGQQTSGLARTTSRPYLHEDPRAKITNAKASRPLSSHAGMSSAAPSGKIVGTAQLVSATHRPLSGSASQQAFQTYAGQPQPAFGSSSTTNRIPDGFGNITPRTSSKGATGARKERSIREGRKNSARAEYEAQYQEYVNDYAKKREQKATHQEFIAKRIENPIVRKVVPSLKLDDLASNFHAMVKSPPLSPNSARTAGRPAFGLEFVREEDQGAVTTRGILASNEYARKRGGEVHSARRADKASSQGRQIPAPTYGNYFSHQQMAQPYANIQQITALQKGSSIASSQNQGTVGSIRSEQELSGAQNMGPIPEIKPQSGANSARGNKSQGKKPNKLKSTDLAPSASTTTSSRRPQYPSKVQTSSNYHQQQKSPVVSTIGYRVRQGSQSNLTSGSMKSKGELPSGELSYGSSKENQPSSRHILLQSTPKNLSKPKEPKFNPIPSQYEVGHYQTPLHLTSSASRSQRGGSVSSNNSQQPTHYNQVPNVASKMTASVLAKRQPSVRGVSSSSNSSNGSQRPVPHHQRSKEKHDTFGSGHYGGFVNRQSFGQLGGGYSQYNYQQPQIQHPANQHYNGSSAAVRDQAFGGQSSARGSHYDYLMSNSGGAGKHSLLSRQSPYEVKLQNSGHYTKPQSSGVKKKMTYSRSVESLQGSKGVRGYQAHYQAQVAQAQHRHQAPLTGTPVQSAQETKFLKTLEQKTNQFLKAHNSREKFFSGAQDFSLKNEDLKYTSTHYGGKTHKEASEERFLGTQSYPKHHHMFK